MIVKVWLIVQTFIKCLLGTRYCDKIKIKETEFHSSRISNSSGIINLQNTFPSLSFIHNVLFLLSIAKPPSFFAREYYVNQSQTFIFSPDFSPEVQIHVSCWSLHVTFNWVFPKQNSSLSPFFTLTKRKEKKKKAKRSASVFAFPASVNHNAHPGNHPPLLFTSP